MILKPLLSRLRGRQTWRYYHFDESHVAQPFRRVPLRQSMMVDDLRLVYLPIAKNACSSLKTLVAELGGMTLAEGQDIHAVLDEDPNNLVFLNRAEADIRAALADPGWMRFTVLRDPIDRLVSAYVEKFVIGRHAPGMRITIDPVLLRSLNRWELSEQDYDRGITFRQFAHDVLGEPPHRLDPHWRPQSLFLDHIPHTHIYTVAHLPLLKRDLEAHTGQSIALPEKNRVRTETPEATSGPCLADTLPGDLQDPARISINRFLDAGLRAALTEYYAHDLTLLGLVGRVNDSSTGRIA